MKIAAVVLLAVVAPVSGASAQAQNPSTSGAAQQDQDGAVRVRLPVLTVTAQKEAENPQEAPVSVTVVTREVLESADIRSVGEAAAYAPNTFFSDFSARKLSNARFRGIGASPANPAVTTYIDGVPQLNANSSSIDLLGVEQIEFVRGPQSALFGRNTIGGLINVSSARPSLTEWGGSLVGPLGNFTTAEGRFTASGPLVANRLGLAIAAGYAGRGGFTTNQRTGNDLDSRSATFAKTQLLWIPAAAWETRFILTGERARDGDYAFNDLDALRARPFTASRDFEGHTYRDIVAPTVLVRRAGRSIDVSASTGFVWWETDDVTDLDYTALPLVTRANNERDFQFTEEVRFASTEDARVVLSDAVTLTWQAGVSAFTQSYDQDAVNSFSPFVLSPFVAFPVDQRSPRAALDDRGIGAYGEATFTIGGRFDGTVGVRGDFEHKEAVLDTFFAPAIAPAVRVSAEESYGDVSPQFTAAYRATPRATAYATAARGFKAGGFNAASPRGDEAYSEEHSWNYEGGVKTLWFADRLSVNAAAFYLTWSDMQVNLPNPFVPGQFFISNAAGATSKGLEIEMNARLAPGCDLFAGLGYTNARFESDSVSGGLAVGGRRLSNTPNYTADFGGQYTVALTGTTNVYGRAEFSFKGDYYYDDGNTQEQEAYALANFRAGVRGRAIFAEVWTKNAFDTKYIPVAFAYPGLAPSGFIGENGAPRTLGVRAGVTF
jgi:iron complex outermembrane receptor protein